MARVRKPQPSLDVIFFNTPEQKILRLLISNSTTSFTPRMISSKLKGVRGLGGADGIMRMLNDLQSLGLVDFVDNHRAARIRDDSASVRILKTFGSVCDLESLKKLLEPLSLRGVLFGSRADGRARSDSDYNLYVVSESPEEVRRIASRHPLGKDLQVLVSTPEMYDTLRVENPSLLEKLTVGVVLWGPS